MICYTHVCWLLSWFLLPSDELEGDALPYSELFCGFSWRYGFLIYSIWYYKISFHRYIQYCQILSAIARNCLILSTLTTLYYVLSYHIFLFDFLGTKAPLQIARICLSVLEWSKTYKKAITWHVLMDLVEDIGFWYTIRYCKILSDIVKYCQILSNIARYYEILSDTFFDIVIYFQIWFML